MRWAAKTESNLLEDNSGREIWEQTGFDELLATWALHWHHVHKLCSAGGKGKQTQGVVCWSWKEFSTPRFCLQVTTSHPITLWQTRYPRRIQIIPILKNTQLKEIKPDTYNSYSLIAERQTLTSINWPMTSWQTVPQHWAGPSVNIPLPLGLGNHERGTQWAKPGAEFLPGSLVWKTWCWGGEEQQTPHRDSCFFPWGLKDHSLTVLRVCDILTIILGTQNQTK